MAKRAKNEVVVPSKVKIGYATFKLSPKDESWSKKQRALGECHSDKSLIEYSQNQNKNELVNTILHEILHAINYIFDIEYKNSKEEEIIVRKLANGLQTVLCDNKDFVEWMIKSMEQSKSE